MSAIKWRLKKTMYVLFLAFVSVNFYPHSPSTPTSRYLSAKEIHSYFPFCSFIAHCFNNPRKAPGPQIGEV